MTDLVAATLFMSTGVVLGMVLRRLIVVSVRRWGGWWGDRGMMNE
jgi:hypothetical protein